MKKPLLLFTSVVGLCTPVLAYAALDGIKGFLGDMKTILNLTIPVVFGLAMIYFFWGVGQFILKSGDETGRKEGRQKMLWGVVALFVMFSIFGILHFIGNSLDISLSGTTNTTNNINNSYPSNCDTGAICP